MTLYDNKSTCASMGKVISFSNYSNRNTKIDNEENGNNNNYNNYYPGARARVRVREELAEEMDGIKEIYDLYCDAFGRDRVAAIVRREMAQAIEAGAEPSLIAYAIEMAEIAPSPSWAYARAVIKRCMSDGCKTYDNCVARAERVRNAGTERRPQKNNKIPEYQQRDLKDDDYAEGFYVDVMARGRKDNE